MQQLPGHHPRISERLWVLHGSNLRPTQMCKGALHR